MQEGEELRAQGKFLEAADRGFHARALDPGSASASNLLGVIYAETGQPVEARKEFKRAVAEAPSLAAPRINLARLLLQQNEVLPAEDQLVTALKIQPNDVSAWLLLARAQRTRQDRSSASDSFRHALAINPNQAEAHAGLGLLDMDVDHYTAALEHLEAAVRLGDPSPLTRCCLALTLLMGRGSDSDARRAAQLLDEAKHPQIPPSWYAEGLLAKRNRDFGSAAAAFRRLLEVEPRNERAWFALSEAYRGAGKTSEARSALRRHHELLVRRQRVNSLADRVLVEGKRPDLLQAYGQALLDVGQPAEAEAQFRTWLQLAPRSAEARTWLAKAQAARAQAVRR